VTAGIAAGQQVELGEARSGSQPAYGVFVYEIPRRADTGGALGSPKVAVRARRDTRDRYVNVVLVVASCHDPHATVGGVNPSLAPTREDGIT
jgi:hypothetical protein